MDDRRESDKKIDNIIEIITGQTILVKQVHSAVFGNGKKGMKAEFENFKGALSVWRWIAGSGGLIAVGLLIIEIIRFIQ